MNLHDAWISLRHGGNLLSPTELARLPEPGAASYRFAEHLRAALVALDPDVPGGEALSTLLDVVLEEACGLIVGWRKGSAVKEPDAENLLDGTRLKPQRVWEAASGDTLPLFTTATPRIGVGKGRQAVAHVVEYLRRRHTPFALLTNGREWRLIWADTDNLAWAEWDSDRWLDADQLSGTFHVLRRVIARPVLDRDSAERSRLLEAIRATRRGQAKLSSELGERVRQAVEILLRGRQPVLASAWDPRTSKDVYNAACHFVMRLVVILFAEARELFPVDNPIYHQTYGLRGLQDQLGRLTAERRRERHSAWSRILALFRLLHRGSPHPALTLPEYGGELFKPGDPDGDGLERALARLEATNEPPDDNTIYGILERITRTKQQGMPTPVNFTELTSEYIGILYEGLLDYELHRAGDQPVLFLNLGDQPALPLDQLEGMSDKTLAALVEKATVTNKSDGEDEAEETDAEDADVAEDADDGDGVVEEGTEVAETELPLDDDDHARARARAVAWSRRAVVVGKLVKKPAGRNADKNPEYLAELNRAAEQLVAGLKLPGELYLVRWGGTRKGAGTFYTRPQLTLPTVRRTLEPLTHDEAGVVRPPEELLDAQGLRPRHGLGQLPGRRAARAHRGVVESLHVHTGGITSSTTATQWSTVTASCCRGRPRPPIDGFDERLTAIVRRAVVEHCLYGVDLDPLAVELARVSLWVETLDRKLPFTFLDHKLRCGDALVGTWIDRFRDYPLLAWWRQSPDEKWRGVTHDGDVWADALKDKRKDILEEQKELISGQKNWLAKRAPPTTSLKAAIDRVRELYRRLRKVPASQPDKRAELWREQIKPDPALARVREAFDMWCALWFWPLDELKEAPGPGHCLHPPTRRRRSPAAPRTGALLPLGARVPRRVHGEGRRLRRHRGEPAVGDPQAQQQGVLQRPRPALPLLRQAGGAAPAARGVSGDPRSSASGSTTWGLQGCRQLRAQRGRAVRRRETMTARPPLVGLVPRKADETRGCTRSGPPSAHARRRLRIPQHAFRHQGSADLNSYKLFVEQAHALLKPGGQLGLITPSGLYTDKGTVDLRRLLLDRCAWRWLYGFENRNKLFDIHRSFKFAVTIAQKGGKTDGAAGGVSCATNSRTGRGQGALAYPAERIHAFSPKSLSVLEIRSERDLEVLTKIYANSVLLGDDGPDGWGIKYATEFHMTNDSKLFIPREKAEEAGYKADEYGRWIGPDGDVLLPLYEGRMIGQFDFSKKGWVSGKGRTAVWRDIPGKRSHRAAVLDARAVALSSTAHRPPRTLGWPSWMSPQPPIHGQ
jgi:hypothetical protein